MHWTQQAAGVLCCLPCIGALVGHSYPFQGNQAAGFVEDSYGSTAFSQGSSFGIHGSGRMYLVKNWLAPDWWAAHYHRFDLRGKTLSFTADLSAVQCGVVASLYFTAMPNAGPGSNYCDMQIGGCQEIDLLEANSRAYEVSLHSQTGSAFDGTCNDKGCSTNVGRYPYTLTGGRAAELYGPNAYINSAKPFQVKAKFDSNGIMEVELVQGTHVLPVYNKTSANNVPDVPWQNQNNLGLYPKPQGIPAQAHGQANSSWQAQGGLVLVASMWTAPTTYWLDAASCGGAPRGNIGGSSFTISDLAVASPSPSPPRETTPKHSGSHDVKPKHSEGHKEEPKHSGSHEAEHKHSKGHKEEPKHSGSHDAEPKHSGGHDEEPKHSGSHDAEPKHSGSDEEAPEHSESHKVADDRLFSVGTGVGERLASGQMLDTTAAAACVMATLAAATAFAVGLRRWSPRHLRREDEDTLALIS